MTGDASPIAKVGDRNPILVDPWNTGDTHYALAICKSEFHGRAVTEITQIEQNAAECSNDRDKGIETIDDPTITLDSNKTFSKKKFLSKAEVSLLWVAAGVGVLAIEILVALGLNFAGLALTSVISLVILSLTAAGAGYAFTKRINSRARDTFKAIDLAHVIQNYCNPDLSGYVTEGVEVPKFLLERDNEKRINDADLYSLGFQVLRRDVLLYLVASKILEEEEIDILIKSYNILVNYLDVYMADLRRFDIDQIKVNNMDTLKTTADSVLEMTGCLGYKDPEQEQPSASMRSSKCLTLPERGSSSPSADDVTNGYNLETLQRIYERGLKQIALAKKQGREAITSQFSSKDNDKLVKRMSEASRYIKNEVLDPLKMFIRPA